MLLGDKPIGSTVVFNINGEPVEFLVVHKGLPSEENYDKSCNGVWCLAKHALWKVSMNANSSNSAYNDYAKTTINTYLNTTFLESFDQEIQEQIKEVKIPYYSSNSGGGGSLFEGENGLTVKIFFLSGKEVGFTELTGAKLDYFSEGTYKIDKVAATADGTTAKWWTRDRNGTSGNNLFITVNQAGTKHYSDNWSSSPSVWARPAFILPFDFPVPDDEPETDMPPSSALCYIIKTSETAGCLDEKVYSVKETRIGTWIDGKPLYRKVVTIVSPDKALTNKTYPFDASVDTMVSLHGVLQSQKSVSTSKYPLPFFYEENVYLSVWYSEGTLFVRAGSGAVEYLNQPVTVCLEYTKATDEGGAT